jgi:peptidyl-prolyl cis-trans isomerase A (cyclophilin A)
MVQFGISGDRKVNSAWTNAQIQDDPVKKSNLRGFLSFATAGPDTRTTQLFINFGNNATLDGMGFAPIGEVIEGMDIVDSIYSGYGEGQPRGEGPNQQRMKTLGDSYLSKEFPKLDYIQSASVID